MDNVVKTPNERQLHVVFTLGVPGLGKSFLINKLKAACRSIIGLAHEVCVSDDVRSGVLAVEYANRKLDVDSLPQEQIYKIESECGPQIKEAFNQEIEAKLKKLKESGCAINLFVIDKNFCTKVLVDYVDAQAKKWFPDAKIYKAIIVPDDPEDKSSYMIGPLSFDTLTIGLIRSLTRHNHITMNHGSTHVLLSYFGCLVNQATDDFQAKFPQTEFRRVKANYYDEQVVTKFRESNSNQAQYERLRQVVNDLAHKKAQVSDHQGFITSVIQELIPMNAFPTFTDKDAQAFLQNLLAV